MEVYLEGDVDLRQDENKVAGKGDQKTYHATRAYYDFLTDRFVGLDGRGRRLRPGLDRPDEGQVASDRAVPARWMRRPDGTVTYGRARDPGRPDHDRPEAGSPTPAYDSTTGRSTCTREYASADRPEHADKPSATRATPMPPGPDWRIRRSPERLLDGLGSRLLLAAVLAERRRSRAAPAPALVPDQQLLRPAGPHRLERLPRLRPAASPSGSTSGTSTSTTSAARTKDFPALGQRDRLVRQRPDPRPDRPVRQGPGQDAVVDQRLFRLLRHLGPERLRQRHSGLWSGDHHQRRRRGQGRLPARLAVATRRRAPVPGHPRPVQHPPHAAVPAR